MSGSTDAGHAVIVGVTSRTGEAIARRLRRSGWTIEGTARSRARAEETLGGIDAEPFVSGAPSRAASLDLSDGESIEGFLSGRTGDVPATDLLVIAGAPFEETPLAEARMADFLEHAAAQAAGPALLAAGLSAELTRSTRPGGAAVIFFGDIHARLRPRAGATPYLAGKASIESLVPLLAIELAPVRVFGIAPGVIAWAEEFDEDRRRRYLERVPLGREGTVEEAAELAVALVDTATYTTGIVIPIDGGRHLR